MKIENVKKIVLELLKGIALLAVVVYSASTLFRSTDPSDTKFSPSETLSPIEGRICSRSQPYNLEPEFERAISLIKQRYDSMSSQLYGHEGDDWIYNCLYVEYGEVGHSEGVFYFDDRISSREKLVIRVSPSYRNADDLLTSLLLYHEIQHAGQYALFKQYGTESTCIQDETAAFHWQYQFFRWMNKEERQSIAARSYYGELSSTPVHAQIRMLEDLAVFSNAAESACASKGMSTSWDCYAEQFVPKVEKWVRSNPYYQEQCKGDL